MTSTSVFDFLSILRHGNPIYSADPKEDALNAILGTDDSDSSLIITANDLQAEPRLVMNVVHRILFPKSGAFEYISERDLAVMYHIIDGLPFDFPKMFMHYLKEASHQAKMNLPYGMALTKIFLESGVLIPSDEPKEVLKHVDFYTLGTLSRMGFKKEDGRWTRKIVSAPIPSEVPPPSPMEHRRSPTSWMKSATFKYRSLQRRMLL